MLVEKFLQGDEQRGEKSISPGGGGEHSRDNHQSKGSSSGADYPPEGASDAAPLSPASHHNTSDAINVGQVPCLRHGG